MLLKLINKAGITRYEAAKRFDIPHSTMTRWVSEGAPGNVEKLIKLVLWLQEQGRK